MNMPNVIMAGKYTWIRPEGDYLVVGLNEYILHEFGEVASVDLPEVGDEVEEGDDLFTVETYKGMVAVYAPFGGQIIEVNDEIFDTPDLINMDPYGPGWLLILAPNEIIDLDME